MATTEARITYSYHSDGFAHKGDSILVNEKLPAVVSQVIDALSAVYEADTEGVWNLSVRGVGNNGKCAMSPGDMIFINTKTCLLSRKVNKRNKRFGYVLDAVPYGQTVVAAVKIQGDPDSLVNTLGELVDSSIIGYGGIILNGMKKLRK